MVPEVFGAQPSRSRSPCVRFSKLDSQWDASMVVKRRTSQVRGCRLLAGAGRSGERASASRSAAPRASSCRLPAGERDHVEGGVQLPVAAAVEAVPLLAAAGGIDGAGAGEGGEGGLGAH